MPGINMGYVTAVVVALGAIFYVFSGKPEVRETISPIKALLMTYSP